ncbi:Sorting nexin mvp1 [Spiromyces aspiralis]|uniref:Sorting nexin mvp1 n=1 Tax=Spiromyces aspiralis TaxID=68401 RepID=A0ACC1HYE6_9FUNG|nr:Sorting nexin mvp1 [Spiromyces aspiralis]
MFSDNPWGTDDSQNSFAVPTFRSSLDVPPVLSHDIPAQHHALFSEVSGGMSWATADILRQLFASAGLSDIQISEARIRRMRPLLRTILSTVNVNLEEPATMAKFSLAVSLATLAQNGLAPTLDMLEQYRDDLPELKINETAHSSELGHIKTSLDGDKLGYGSDDTTDEDEDEDFGEMESAMYGTNGQAASGKGAAVAVSAAASAAAMSRLSLEAQAKPRSGSVQAGEQRPTPESVGRNVSRAQSAKTSISDVSVLAENESPEDLEVDQWKLDKEDVTVKEAKEKGGVLFKHINYEVTSKTFASHVVRRYNDFFWISEYMVKRYPYRMLPNIPPKGFPDNRILGLTRFSNAIVRTPFLRKDRAIQAFFKSKEEFSRVIKASSFPTTPERPNIEELKAAFNFEKAQRLFASLEAVTRKIDQDEAMFRSQIIHLEKIARFSHGIGEEMYGISNATRQHNVPRESGGGPSDIPEGVRSVISSSRPRAMRVLRDNMEEVSMHFGNTSLLEKAKAEVAKSVTAEHMRRYYDVIVSLKHLISRLKDADKAPTIEKVNERIEYLRQQLGRLQNQPDTSLSSIEKINHQLKDEFDNLDGLNYEVELMQLRFYQEIRRYERTLSFLGTIYSQISQDQIKHHTLMLNAWKQALEASKSMPTNPLDYV